MLRERHEIIIKQFNPGTLVKGVYTKGTMSGVLTIKCNLQPVTGKQLEFFPEGERRKIRYTAYLNEFVAIGIDDIAFCNGEEMKIYLTNPWKDQGKLSHNQIFLGDKNDK
jgi:hypothetical protein